MRISNRGLALIKEFEGFRERAYIPVPGDVPTIGYGTTEGVKMGDIITREQAEIRLRRDLRKYEDAVTQALTLAPNQHEYDACVSLCYNIGTAGFARSTVCKAHNRGDKQAAARAFGLWNKSSGIVYDGLTRRRAREAALYLEPVNAYSSPQPFMPQRVDPESRMSESPINRAGVVAGGTAAVATVAETARTVADVKYSADSLGDWLVPILLVVVVALCCYIVWERVKVRNQGWS